MTEETNDLRGLDPELAVKSFFKDPDRQGLDPDLAIKSFFKDPDWVFKSALGGVLNASSLVLLFLSRECLILIPICFSLWAINTGFVLRMLRSKIGEPGAKIPNWSEWQDLFISGMSWLAIVTGFLMFLFGLSMTNLLIAAAMSAVKTYNEPFVIWMSTSIIVLSLLSLFFNLLLSVTMANFAQEESMLSAFAFIKVLKRIFRHPGDFICAWLLGIGIQWLAVVIPCATVIGIFFLPSTMFLGQLIAASIMAQAWSSSNA